MNKLINTLMMFSMILLVGSITSCKDSEGAKAEISNKGAVAEATGVIMGVDLDNSKVMWEGTKPTGSHNGTVNVGGGSVSVKDGKVTGGNFTLDMNSITCLDLEGDSDFATDDPGEYAFSNNLLNRFINGIESILDSNAWGMLIVFRQPGKL